MSAKTSRSFLRPSLSWLVIFIPAAFAVRYVPGWQNQTALFVIAALAIIPIAGWMGNATEQLAHRLGEGVGGLLNASFGNAAELIIALMALKAGLIDVVKASITGSIIGNLLLVLGISIFAGGLKHRVQRFNKTAARASCTALIIASAALVVPSIFHQTAARHDGWTPEADQRLSFAMAFVLLGTYAAILIFSLVTHRELFVGAGQDPVQATKDRKQEDAHEHVWSVKKAVLILFGATVLVAWVSEFLVSAVEAAQHSFGVTETFVGVIVVAIVGNAAEHSTAVTMAIKNKMDLSLGIAVGSSIQIALFVTPVLVFASYLFPRRLSLEFSLPEIAAVVISGYLADQISGDGESNWLEGIQLLALYIILGMLFYFLPAGH